MEALLTILLMNFVSVLIVENVNYGERKVI